MVGGGERRGPPRGVALINALVVVAALAAVSVALLQRAERARQRVADLLPADQAALYLDAATHQVQEVVAATTGGRDGESDAVHLDQGWAEPVLDTPIGRGQVGWRIADLQGRFNLGWLQIGAEEDEEQQVVAEEVRAAFGRLAREQGVPREQVRRLEQALAPQLGQRFSAYGRTTRPPPLPPFALDELLLVRGMDAATLNALRPFVTTLPADAGGLNLNTVSPEVLVALLPRQSEASIAARLEAARPFEDIEAALSWIEGQAGPEAVALFEALGADVRSDWFEARIEARLDTVHLRRRVVMQRAGGARCCRIKFVLPEVE